MTLKTTKTMKTAKKTAKTASHKRAEREAHRRVSEPVRRKPGTRKKYAKPPKHDPNVKRSRGAPSIKTPEMIDQIIERLANGMSLNAICRMDGMPSAVAVFDWLSRDSDFAKRYARAREEQAELLAQEIVEIADDTEGEINGAAVQAARLRVEARKWVASKLKPKTYGDHVSVDQRSEVLLHDERSALRDKILQAVAEGEGAEEQGKAPPVH